MAATSEDAFVSEEKVQDEITNNKSPCRILATQPPNKTEISAKHREREEKVKNAQRKKVEERKKKLEELREAQKRASEFRERQQEERRKKLLDMRNREIAKREAVEQRRKRLEEDDKQKVLEKIRRLEERDARLDEIRRSRYSGQLNAAFGSTPSRAQSHCSLRPAVSPRRATSAFSLSSNVLSTSSNNKSLSSSVMVLTSPKGKPVSRMTSSTLNLRRSKVNLSSESPRSSKSVSDGKNSLTSVNSEHCAAWPSPSKNCLYFQFTSLRHSTANGSNKSRSLSVQPIPHYARHTCSSAIRCGREKELLSCCHVRSSSTDSPNRKSVRNKLWSEVNRNVERLSTPKSSKRSITPSRSSQKFSPGIQSTSPQAQKFRPKSPSPVNNTENNLKNEEEYKIRLAENRRRAREKADKEKEEERMRKLEQIKKREQEEQERIEEEIRLAKEREEQERIEEEIRLAKEREEQERIEKEKILEEKKKQEEEAETIRLEEKIKQAEEEERLEKERKLRQETEQRERERIEKQAKEEEERLERKRKLEGIMKRFKTDQTASNESTPASSPRRDEAQSTSDKKSAVLQKVLRERMENDDKKFQSPLLKEIMAKRSTSSTKLDEESNNDSQHNNNQVNGTSPNRRETIEQVIQIEDKSNDDMLNSNEADPPPPFVAFEENANLNQVAGNV